MYGLENAEFTALMQQYQRLVYTVCCQFVHDADLAQDLTQDTFLSAYSGIDRCDPAYYKQWLVRVAANKCKDHLRSAWARRVQNTGEDPLPEPSPAFTPMPPGPAEQQEQEAGAVELQEMIRTLREPYGRVATLYFLEEKPVAEIARALSRPEKTVQNQVFRAKAILRKQISERRQL